MIVARMKLDFADAGWDVGERINDGVRRVFEKVTGRDTARNEEGQALARMPLAELLYYALLGDGAPERDPQKT